MLLLEVAVIVNSHGFIFLFIVITLTLLDFERNKFVENNH